jgi:hypothetical protein
MEGDGWRHRDRGYELTKKTNPRSRVQSKDKGTASRAEYQRPIEIREKYSMCLGNENRQRQEKLEVVKKTRQHSTRIGTSYLACSQTYISTNTTCPTSLPRYRHRRAHKSAEQQLTQIPLRRKTFQFRRTAPKYPATEFIGEIEARGGV